MNKLKDLRKVAIVGCGNVGMTTAYAILMKNLVQELVLLGRDKSKIIGEQLDLEHGLPFMGNAKVMATDDYADLKDSNIVIVTAGAAQKPGDTRLDLTHKNIAIFQDIIPKIVKHAPHALILVVSNPVDILTYHAYQIAGWPKGRIFGSGTTLDTARFRFHLSEFLDINPRSIHAYILGEHGDSSFPALFNATVGGQPLSTLKNYTEERALKAFDKTQNSAYRIIDSKGATYYAIGVVVAHMVETIFSDARRVMPLSIPLHGFYGLHGLALSAPCILGRDGVQTTLEIKLSAKEREQLYHSAEILKKNLQLSGI